MAPIADRTGVTRECANVRSPVITAYLNFVKLESRKPLFPS